MVQRYLYIYKYKEGDIYMCKLLPTCLRKAIDGVVEGLLSD